MNYSYISQEVEKNILIYDQTCIYCLSIKTKPEFDKFGTNQFYCNNCNKLFTSTKIRKQIGVSSRGKKIPKKLL